MDFVSNGTRFDRFKVYFLVQLKADIFGMDTLVLLGALRAKKSSARASVKGDERKREKADRNGGRSSEGSARSVARGFRSLSLFPFALVFRSFRFFLCGRAWLTRQM